MNNSELKAQIRKALAGSSMRCPVMMSNLLKIGSGASDALEQMEDVGEIVSETLDGRPAFWFAAPAAGFPSVPIAFQYPRTPPRQPTHPQPTPNPPLSGREPIISSPDKGRPGGVTKVQPNTSTMQKKEKTMSQQRLPITDILVEIVHGQPGIAIEPLVAAGLQRAKGTTEAQARKCVQNLIHKSKKLRQVIADGERTFYPNDGKAAPAKANKPAKAKKAKPAKPAEPVGAGDAREQKASRARPAPTREAGDADFSIMLSENCDIHVTSGATKIVLTREQVGRLYRFTSSILA